MPMFKLPLSGDVVQTINPFTAFFSPSGSGQFGLINIHLGQSSAPELEQEILTDVGSYGKQLGKIGDALAVLIKFLPADAALSEDDRTAISELKALLAEVAEKKNKYRSRTQSASA